MPATNAEPLIGAPGEGLLARLAGLPSPALLYDLDNLRRSVELLRADVEGVGPAELNLALKACHTPRVLTFLASLGLGADVASVGELTLAVLAGFRRITATGPSFRADDLPLLAEHGVVPDASSVEQLDEFCTARPGGPVGLRLRVPLPEAIEDGSTTFGAGSRFGVYATDPRIGAVLERTGCRLTRLHTHTGQMTPRHLRYKLRYLLAVAASYPDVEEIDLGGGFFSLYTDRLRTLRTWQQVAEDLADFTRRTGRTVRLQFEPGGAVLAPHGYLVTTVRSAERDHPHFKADVLTVDCSAWNFAPWHRPQLIPLTGPREDEELRPTLLAGDTLYENDFFGTDVLGRRSPAPLPALRAGDRVVLTASGAYTRTNSRRFNLLPLPAEYALADGKVEELG
ncbi:diaminopimelate decarboxylase [Kitasatospora albolonga]|uniref:diaminopimelate decarboxylase family protein n=1 Tax=Kitasatospora albolonga TaxID=68173 RepID=UPI0031EBF141